MVQKLIVLDMYHFLLNPGPESAEYSEQLTVIKRSQSETAQDLRQAYYSFFEQVG